MSFTNGSAVSAFAVYKQKFTMKQKTSPIDQVPLKKRKQDVKEVITSNDTSNVVLARTRQKQKVLKHTTPLLSSKIKVHQSRNKKLMKDLSEPKPIKKLKKTNKLIRKYGKDEPPLLVPIIPNDTAQKNIKKQKKVEKSINFAKAIVPNLQNTSLSEILTDLHKTDPSPEGLKLFKWLIATVSPKEFFDEYWEKEILYIERDSPNYYSQLLTTQRVDDIFREFPLYYTRNVDVVSYENGVKEVHNQEGRVVASALYDFYSNGCSIRVLNPQTYDQKIHLLIATLQEYFGTMVGTNVYLTPPGSQGFAPHFDDIEAFIIQLEGRKHWKLYKPKDADILTRESSQNFTMEEIGSPIMEVTVNAGDLLYFPRGTIHEGRTDDNAHSLHITVSVYQHTAYIDLLEHIVPQALKKAAQEDLSFRRGLPLHYLKHLGQVNTDVESEERSTIMNKVKYLMLQLINYVDMDQAADKLGRKFMYDSMPPVLSKLEVKYTSKYDGDYMQDGKVFNRVEIGMDTEVRLVRYHSLRLVIGDEGAKIYYNTDNAKVYHEEEEQFLIIDNSLIPCIKKLQNIYPEFIEVEKLPGKDNMSKAYLVSDLWERGLLVTNGPLPSFSEDELISDGMSDSSV